MQAIGWQPRWAPDADPARYEQHRPEQTTLYRLLQQHAASFIAHSDASTGGECRHDKLLAFSCKRCGLCLSCGARRMAQTAACLVDRLIPHMPARAWVLSLPIPLRLLLAAQPELVPPVLQVVQRGVTRHLLARAALKARRHRGHERRMSLTLC